MANKTALDTVALKGTDLTKDGNNKLTFGAVVQADQDDVDSIDTRVSEETSTRESKVSSEDLRVSKEESNRTAKVGSLDTRISEETSTRTSKVNSVNTRMEAEEDTTTIQTLDLTESLESKVVTYDYATVPAIVGMLRSTAASDPIVACMLVGTPTATDGTTSGSGNFVFSEALPSANYKLDIILST